MPRPRKHVCPVVRSRDGTLLITMLKLCLSFFFCVFETRLASGEKWGWYLYSSYHHVDIFFLVTCSDTCQDVFFTRPPFHAQTISGVRMALIGCPSHHVDAFRHLPSCFCFTRRQCLELEDILILGLYSFL